MPAYNPNHPQQPGTVFTYRLDQDRPIFFHNDEAAARSYAARQARREQGHAIMVCVVVATVMEPLPPLQWNELQPQAAADQVGADCHCGCAESGAQQSATETGSSPSLVLDKVERNMKAAKQALHAALHDD